MRRFQTVMFKVIDILAILTMVLGAPMSVAAAPQAEGESAIPTLTTDKADYMPDEVVTITGSGFQPLATLDIPVTRPNGSIVKGDGSFELGWDTVTTDEQGGFTYYYQLNGVLGEYVIEVYPLPWEGPESDDTLLASAVFSDHTSMTLSINNGASNTGLLDVTLRIAWSGSGGDPTQVRFANDLTPTGSCNSLGGGTWGAWQTITEIGTSNEAEFSWTLAAGADGSRRVCAETAHGTLGSPSGTRDAYDMITYLYSAPNPELGASCGLDIALVIDNSTSISSSELSQIKSAMTAFTGALNGTPTWFSVTRFATNAEVLQPFTADISAVNAAINSIPTGGGSTNWQDALTKAYSTFDSDRADKPDLVIFASDGNPNRPSGYEASDVAAAVVVANTIKTDGIRILAIGVGSDLDTPNMVAISGPNVDTGSVFTSDVITSDFDELAADLAAFATETCGGTISVYKVIDADGDTTTTDDQSNGTGWHFSAAVSGGSASPTEGDTASDGSIVFDIDIDGSTASVDIAETLLGGFDFISASCLDGSTPVGTPTSGAVNDIVIGQQDVLSCKFYNRVTPGSITIIKDAAPDSGQDFNFTTEGLTPVSFVLDDDDNPALSNVQEFNNVIPGTYVVTETSATGWDISNLVCTDATGDTSVSGNSATIHVDPGEAVTCTFTNTLQQGTLIVKKELVIDNGGTKTYSDFSFQVNGGDSVAFESDGQNELSVPPGSYTVVEPVVTGYTTTYNNCSDVTVTPGGTATCTITNDDQPGTLIVEKEVINDNGGTLGAEAFSFSVNGGDLTPFEADGVNQLTVDAGTYTVTEAAVDGYTTSYTNCADVAVPNGGSTTCTITNDDKAGKLIIEKVVVNDNGGALAAKDFSFSVNGGTAVTFEEDGVNEVIVDAGTYSITEPAVEGYATTYSNCSNVDIPLGGSATCTITNDDIQPRLIVTKHVVNDHGGQADAADFTIKVTGTNASPAEFPGDEAGTTVQLDAGSYSVSEDALDGYLSSYSVGCSGSIGIGETKYCTVTNDDQPGTIIVEKRTDPAGLAGNFEFTGDAAGTIADGGSIVVSGLSAGTYSSSELPLKEWQLTGIACDDDNSSGDVATATATFNLENGETVKCVFTNDPLPRVSLGKAVDVESLPEPGGVFNFKLTITNESAEPVEITALTDDNILSAECTALVGTTLAVGESVSCNYAVTHTDAGTYPNTAEVTVKDNENNEAVDTAAVTVAVTDEKPTVDLTKEVSPLSLAEPGGLFTYTLTIENKSVEKVTITALTDTNTLSTECTALVGTELAVGAKVNCTYTATYSEAGTYPNTAEVTVKDNENNEASDKAEATATVTDEKPDVDLKKEVSPLSLAEPGGLFTYTLTIENKSVEKVTITALTDTNTLSAECTALIGTELAVGGKATCTYIATYTEAGAYPNVAKVTVKDNEDNEASDEAEAAAAVTDEKPAVDLTKEVSPLSLAEPGGLFAYTLTIENKSVEKVTITALTDTNTLSAECTALVGTELVVGGKVSCTYTATYTEAGTYPNTAKVTVKDNEDNEASDEAEATAAVTDEKPAVDLTKEVSPLSLPEPGGLFTYTLTIENKSVEKVTITALTDTNTLSAECTALVGTELAVGGKVSCTYTAIYTEANTYPNAASVTVKDNENNEASDEAEATATVTDEKPAVDLTKEVSPLSQPEPGGLFTYTLTIENKSVEKVTITALTDTNALSAECTALVGTELAVGGKVSCTYTLTYVEPGVFSNKAIVTVKDNENNEASDEAEATATVTDVKPVVDLTKTIDPLSLPEPGGLFTYTLTIENKSVEKVTITALTDTNTLSAECTALIGTELAVGGKVSCTYTLTYTVAGEYPNKAAVTVKDNENNEASDEAEATAVVTDAPDKLTITKTADTDHVPAGKAIGFTITVHNDGPGTAYNAILSDMLPTAEGIAWSVSPAVAGCSITGSALTCDFGNLANGATRTVHITSPTTSNTCGVFDNTATLTSNVNDPVSATAKTASYCDLRVSKTVIPTFKRVFYWNILKSVDKSFVRQVGGSATFKYTVIAKQTGFTDSDWKLTGQITITNPNPIDVSGIYVKDFVNNLGVCTIDVTNNFVVPANSSRVLDYTCAYSTRPSAYFAKNIVEIKWSQTAGTPTAFARAVVNFSFGGKPGVPVSSDNPLTVNGTVTITDTFDGETTTLGTAVGIANLPYTLQKFLYTRDVTMPTYGCKSYTNTAKIVETSKAANRTIKVCGPMDLGSKTIGFWKNPGQDIIKNTGSLSGTNICKLTSWLKGYAPFRDLSPTASCSDVATYVYNVMKAASGSSMNAMLKAQMLATALDVYYSDPALGGNQIGAPAPIGGTVVDLTYVKVGSGYQNVSAAFGGATKKTVLQMLAYAASKSNNGGTTWYGNVKAVQEKAKNAFDAINNNWVFPP
ncbi:MAG: VWA domain-containing protein [Chloroflexi bacterium]|nr:VWA domain-containing protein [Chloroflexota bacterium]